MTTPPGAFDPWPGSPNASPLPSPNIVLLDANPLADIKHTQTVWRVIKGGFVFDPEELRLDRNYRAKKVQARQDSSR